MKAKRQYRIYKLVECTAKGITAAALYASAIVVGAVKGAIDGVIDMTDNVEELFETELVTKDLFEKDVKTQ